MRDSAGLIAMFVVVANVLVGAEQPTLEGVLDRLTAYTGSYADKFSTVVADESSFQWLEVTLAGTASRPERRSLRSDYALTKIDDTWVAYRDPYEVDGVRVRDRDDRLMRLMSSGRDDALQQIAAILADNARFNLAGDRVSRNINVPTLVIQLLHPDNRSHFSFAKDGETSVDGHRRWRINFRERGRPTLVRRRNDADQPVHGTVWVDPSTGEIWRTNLVWESGPGGNIAVKYGRMSDIDVLVPLTMSEVYKDPPSEIRGEARYSNFRRFRTAGRLIIP